MIVASYKNIYCWLAAVTALLAAGWWLVALESSWQQPMAEQGLALTGLQPGSRRVCGRVNNDFDAGSQCVLETSKASRLERGGAAQGPEPLTNYADAVEPVGDKVSLQSSQYIDVYDPSTWPVDSNDSADLPDVVPIDLYDPQTWPGEINQEVDPAGFQSIDLYDSNTWPAAGAIQAEAVLSVGEEGFDVYDASTWPEAIGSAASGDSIIPIDPYDKNTWPEQ